MSRSIRSLIALCLVAVSCSPFQERSVDEATASATTPSSVAEAPETPSAVNTSADEPAPQADERPAAAPDPEPAESEPAAEFARLLPDGERWVVIQDWSERAEPPASQTRPTLQLDVAPLDADGVPDLGRRIHLMYRLGAIDDFDEEWGDASSLGADIDFEIVNGVGRVVADTEAHFSMAQVWTAGTYVTVQSMDPEAELRDVAESLTAVDAATWTAAREGAADQRLRAVEAAMTDIEPVAPVDEPLPHWVLPAPWEPEWVTDKTIWTPEQHAQSAALSEANRPAHAPQQTGGWDTWYFGFGEAPDEARTQFVPEVTIAVGVLDELVDPMHPINYERVSALGLDGVISLVGGAGASVELGTGTVRVGVQTVTHDLDVAKDFLDAASFASDDPLAGFIVSDDRFQPIELPAVDREWPSWHASWKGAGVPTVTMSVWRLSVPQLRHFLLGRGSQFDVPADIAASIASDEAVDLGSGATYDPTSGILMQVNGVEVEELIPIELDAWIELVEPVNSDPLNPR